MYAPLSTNLIRAERAWMLLKLGEKGEAQAWIEGNLERVGGTIPYMQEEDVVYLARLLTALNRHEEALQLSDRLLEPVEIGGRTGRLVEILVIRALAFHGLGETASALETLQHSLILAEPEGYQRIFLDAGEKMHTLLALVTGDSFAYAKKLLSSYDKVSKPVSKPASAPVPRTMEPPLPESDVPIEALSERELEVLRLIAQGYSNQQIADQLYISLNTTKTHVKNILGRLQVENRTQAAARARELGVL
jgi:LuxR family maltose regulon positive regulatory protein